MRWSDERYVRLYTRDTPDWVALGWEAQCLFMLILRKVDRAGILKLGRHGARGLARMLYMPELVVESALATLLDDGCVEQAGDCIVIRNFVEAQEASLSDAARKRAQRERDRDFARARGPQSCEVDHVRSRPVTGGHAESRSVTPSLAVPSDPGLSSSASGARMRVADDVPEMDWEEGPETAPSPAVHAPAAAQDAPARPLAAVATSPQEGPDLLAIAHRLADAGNGYGAKMLDWAAQGKTFSANQRAKLKELYAEHIEGLANAERATQLKASPPPAGPAGSSDTELRAWASQRWVEARQKHKLAAQAPDPRLIAELCSIALDAVAGAKPDAKGWRPTARQVIGFWMRRYLLERQDKAGGVEDRGHPLAWLPGRCREYPTPRRSDVERAAPSQPASDGPQEARPATGATEGDPEAAQEPRTPPAADEPPPLPSADLFAAALTAIGTGGSGVLRPRPKFAVTH